MTLGTIGVVGAGQMGAGIAHVAALAGKKVVLVDVTPDLAEKGLRGIEKNLSRQVEKGKVAAADRDAALQRIVATADLSRLAETGLVVEAIVENEAVKRDLFARLDALVPPLTILATNTSSISITRLAAGHEAAGALHRNALHESRARHGARRGDPRDRDVGRDHPGRARPREGAGEDPASLPRLSRLRREPHPDADAERGVLRGARRRRDAGSGGRHHEARHESPDGPARAGRLHRARHVPRDPARPASGARRRQVPSLPAPRADGRRGLAWEEDGPRLLPLRRTGWQADYP